MSNIGRGVQLLYNGIPDYLTFKTEYQFHLYDGLISYIISSMTDKSKPFLDNSIPSVDTSNILKIEKDRKNKDK